MPHLIRKMRHLLKDKKKNLGNPIQAFTILSQQNKGDIRTFKWHNIITNDLQ